MLNIHHRGTRKTLIQLCSQKFKEYSEKGWEKRLEILKSG
jgi:hypothetical protein